MGSLKDHETLEAALSSYHQRAPLTAAEEYIAWVELALAAINCGWTMASPETCVDFAERRVARFQQHFGRRAAA